MTEKRFTYEYDEYNGNLFDNKYDTFYPIEDSEENLELLCGRLNELNDENKELKGKASSWKITASEEIFEKEGLIKQIVELKEENKELKRQVKETIFHIDVLIDVSAPNTERISVLLDLKEEIIETFGEWVILND